MDSKSAAAFPTERPAIRRRGAEDLISGLPDELLHIILVRLPSAAAAARTSVLSRRWRSVWAHMPELVLCLSRDRATPAPTPSAALVNSIDAALNSYAAPTLNSLKIDCCDVDANRIAPWLRFASQRVAGKLCISVSVENAVGRRHKDIEEDLALPICERATEIDLSFHIKIVLRPPQTGSFSALTYLKMFGIQIDGGELGRVVSSPMCPRLRKLRLYVVNLVPTSDVSMSSESVESLLYVAPRTGKLEVTAPMLHKISLLQAAEACIVAPKLEKIEWKGTYDPGRHQFAMTSRHLQSLSTIQHGSSAGSSTRLMERFDTAKSLEISLDVDKGIDGYLTFLKEMNKLPVCETLAINLVRNHHGLLPKMLHILRRCCCIRKLKLLLGWCTPLKIASCTTSGCPCLLPESHRSDNITFDSLEEIEISVFAGSPEQKEFIEVLLSRCNMVTLKRLHITPFTRVSDILEFVKRIRTMFHPNSKVQITLEGAGATGLLIQRMPTRVTSIDLHV